MLRQDNYYSGIPYEDIYWYDLAGQPFGSAINFNAIIFGDANNIVDTKGGMAVGGNFSSVRGLSLGYGNDGKLTGTGYSPNLVRFLVGGNVAMQGPLVVIGHVVGGGSFRAGRGSTYMIGKDGTPDQAQLLTALYQASGGSIYWRLADRNTHYAVSSYDVARFIPAQRIEADVAGFFDDAYDNISYYHSCISDLQPNGTVTEHYHEWILKGDDPVQNVFLIDVRPNGLLNKEIRFEIPEGSIAIVNITTGENAHIQYGLWGSERLAERSLYVFNDAKNIYMEVPAAIWGSILAPQAAFHAHQTGGTVSGNAALGSLMVNATSGFEFHLYPFVGGVECGMLEVPAEDELPVSEEEPTPPAPIPRPEPAPMPRLTPTPPAPMPRPEPAPMPRPTPTPPAPVPRPEPAPMPRPTPTPPAPMPRPEPAPMPRPTPTPPAPMPRPEPAPMPAPPVQMPELSCPECPACPEGDINVEIQPFIPVPIEVPVKDSCKIAPGLIFGCIWGCACCCDHEWQVNLYRSCGDSKKLLQRQTIGSCGCFEFKVAFDDFYGLEICPKNKSKSQLGCKPVLSLKNVGVANLMIY